MEILYSVDILLEESIGCLELLPLLQTVRLMIGGRGCQCTLDLPETGFNHCAEPPLRSPDDAARGPWVAGLVEILKSVCTGEGPGSQTVKAGTVILRILPQWCMILSSRFRAFQLGPKGS